ncbi:disease resistance protein At4g27190-like [Olea europaea var. sylvestris]|uniref:disease resistance protein At4g27190-like n=1 Tax=Olea europaea var. sylvestris TaxID=158386 RepID=UPI000C1D709B|nr:disease resistance protein At4g27190-like [Olea europaea var. sylvestris]XP_022842189.1 disease resistance protein At4g27190-like [Olea europaea var. sylvestris]XP_022842190.1 disease resistance protein At4g27190-like [Olea europaea var. sylvestris]XP_022842191.1 disease resistance protein At4g27190-like [Olea europaea var. sylvestris]XP_022842192.1 disease resistance protein At4g27190-like [Olea europaea var. sylvestris]XP_022842193.1 disease resistance protein At4g27190-like [Olea europae
MTLEIALCVVGKFMEYAIDPLLCQFKYMFCYNKKIQTLMDKVKVLETQESEVRESVRQAKNNVEAIRPIVLDWLQNVEEMKKNADEVFKDATNSKMQCLFLQCPNLLTRYSLGRKATKKAAEVAELQKEGTFQDVGERKSPVQIPYQNPSDFGAFETRISTKKGIMEALKDKDVSIIGICGMGGVGKTTMAKEIANEAKADKLFDEFAWADISQDPNVTKIQNQLAEKLGLEVTDITDKYERAERLRERLGSDRSKSILVILDDVWEYTVLETIGFPSARDDKRLKILLTSRDKDVFTKVRGTRIFNVDLLNEKESWELFKEKAEISDDATDIIKDTAIKIAKKCDGLPLALVIVGRALCKKEKHVWENALLELRTSEVSNIKGVHKYVYSRIKLSYNYLESDEAKSLFLLCSLYPEGADIEIEDLVRYAWGLELFRGTMTLNSTRNRLNTIVDLLKSCYLLLSAETKDRVRLHGVVRDVCLQIASKDNMSIHTSLKVWPKHNNDTSYSAISLTSNELNQLPSGLEYPQLKFLGVMCGHQPLNVSKDFFANMKELKVLDFTSMRIQIPSSIQLLTNLQTLCLDCCTLNIEFSTIGTLKKLEVLSFRGSDLDHFPNDIAELSNLRLLDLRLMRSSKCSPLSPGILLHLKRLEELYMGVIKIRGDGLEQRGYIINEIGSLTCLNTFQISTNDPQFLLQILQVMHIERLDRFHIELANLEYARERYYYFGRRLHIHGITYASVLSQPAINSLMRKTDHLSIKMVLNNPDDLSLQVMERKNVLDEDSFEYLNGNHPTGAFDELQKINLDGIPKMKHLFRGVIKPPSLHNLMFLTIGSCPSLKSLFSESVALCMVNLQNLSISNCEILEEVVSMDTEQNEVNQMLVFPKLQKIKLKSLRNLKSFRCGFNKTIGVLNPLFKQVTFPNLELLHIEGLGCTVKILDELRQIGSLKLGELIVENLDNVNILFDFEHIKDDAEIGILSQLASLVVLSLPDLVHFTRMFPKGIYVYQNLTHLGVGHCDNLRYLFSPSMAHSLVALEVLMIEDCEAIEEIIGREEEEDTSNIEIMEEGMTRRIVFPKLEDLWLAHLDRFRLLSSQNYELVFPSLEYLRIENCPAMTELYSRQQLGAPKLDKVWINNGSVDI